MVTKTARAKKPMTLPRVRRGNVEDAQRMRAALTETALTLFSEGGLDAVSMRGLSARLSISAMTPYHYFADKAELLSALWQHVLKDLHEAVSRAIAARVGARARLRAYIDAFLLYYESHPDEYRLVFLTQHAAHHSENPGADQASIFVELRSLFRRVTSEFAADLGAGVTHLKIAEDLVFIAQLGYLQAALLNRRYPWSERAVLRSACVAQALLMVERCLVDGADGTEAASRS
ncbi:TetR/AcrR family transcriptional regulator [Rivibacter subsaxonicus]|uniref:TetR family transcriptional regulator n=1 Tax=Rivibacter subsaxonicus TaxID=457575 RepID=A0A4Q7V9L4_9BURK|nr:TetR/AcrR family transcriptional regulator [Rivibacter subsaxonicus]RZT92564.1 TetR family transcriptional regulator [Rivibacter subsaxonicus]